MFIGFQSISTYDLSSHRIQFELSFRNLQLNLSVASDEVESPAPAPKHEIRYKPFFLCDNTRTIP
jgi:hypothetical protein